MIAERAQPIARPAQVACCPASCAVKSAADRCAVDEAPWRPSSTATTGAMGAEALARPRACGPKRLDETELAECDVLAIEQVPVCGARAELSRAGRAPAVLDLTPDCDLDKFGGRLRHWRLSSGRTQADVAAMLGVCAGTVRNWERGRTEPSGELVRVVEDVMESEVGD